MIVKVLFLLQLATVTSLASLIPEGKLVLAHYMTNMVPCSHGEYDWADPQRSDPAGFTQPLGGIALTHPYWVDHHPNLSLADAARLEVRTAKAMGLDGFQFYYPFLSDKKRAQHYNTIIRAFLDAAVTEGEPPFKITLCLSLGGQLQEWTQAQRVAHWGALLTDLLSATSTSPAWLRTNKGNLLFYHWINDSFAEGVPHLAQTPEHITKIADAFDAVATKAGEPIDWVFHVRRTETDTAYIDRILSHFPAVWGWTESDENPEFWDALAQRCHLTGTAYTQTVYPDYFTSKVYLKGDEHYQILQPQEAIDVGINGIERHYRQTNLTETQTNLLRAAIDREAAIINYATWNDWPEGHHLAPESHHNFAPSLLLQHFAAAWKGLPSPFATENTAALFYKLHSSQATPTFPIHVRIDSALNRPQQEDGLHLVTWLQSRGRAIIANLPPLEIDSGFQITKIANPPSNTKLHTQIFLEGEESPVIDFTPPEAIQEQPHRTNRLTYSYSSRFETMMAAFNIPLTAP